MIITSVSTIPGRTWSLLRVLEQLKNQTHWPDVLLVTVSDFYPRMNKYFDKNDLNVIKTFLDGLPFETHLIERETDIGSTVKLLSPLDFSRSKDDLIVIFDDDSILYNRAIEIMVKNYKQHGYGVYGIMGIKSSQYVHGEALRELPYDNVEVDLIGGYRGVLYPVNSLGDKKQFHNWIDMFIEEHTKQGIIAMHDDNIFAYYAKRYEIPRRVCKIDEPGWFYFPIENHDGIMADEYSGKSLELTHKILEDNDLIYLINA